MKKRMLVLISGTILLLSSCSKKSESVAPTPTPKPEEGYWQGKYTQIGFLGTTKASMLLKANGTMRYYELGDNVDTTKVPALGKADGVWSSNGNTVLCSYTSGTKTTNFTLSMNAAKNLLSGTWSIGATTKGNIEFNK